MTDVQRERELKFDVPPDFEVPDVADVLPDATVETSTVHLRSTYYDTVGLDLLQHAVTLRRREGDEDTGWHLKIPAQKARDEIRLPLRDGDEPPERLTMLLTGIVRPADLLRIATLETERRLTRVHTGDGLVVELADDRVTAGPAADPGHVTTWRELEIELGPAGDEDALAAFAERVERAGAKQSEHASKLARALGRPPRAQHDRSKAERLVTDYLHENFRRLVAGDIALRRGRDETVHRTRVSVRRIRSVLRIYREAFDTAAADALESELSWYQGLLGEVRDRQVLRARLADAIARLEAASPELVIGPVATCIEQTLLAEQAAAFDDVTRALATRRYRRLLSAVAAFADGAHVRSTTRRKDLHRLASDAAGTARRRLRKGVRRDDPDLLHRARKAAKRARYAAELVGSADGKNRRAVAKAYRHVQDVLGAHQDAVLAADVVHRIGTLAESAAAGSGFTYGVLHQRELDTADELRAQAASLAIPK